MTEIRPAVLSDAEIVTNIQVSAYRHSFKHVSKEILAGLSIKKRMVRWQEQIQREKIELYVLDTCSGTVGFCQIGATSDVDDSKLCGQINKLFIHPDSQKHGFGNLLFEYGIRKLREQQFKEIVLWVAVANFNAINFYARRGFQDDGSRRIDTFTTNGSSVAYSVKDWDNSQPLKPAEALEARYRRQMDGSQGNRL